MTSASFLKSLILPFVRSVFKNYSTNFRDNFLIQNSTMSNVIKIKDIAESALIGSQYIKNGSVIAIPTDTLYGLAVDAQNSEAIEELYKIKKRQHTKPLAICVANISDIQKWANIDHIPDGLLSNLLPGPVTVVLYRTSMLNPNLNPGIHKVAIRIPKHDFVRKLVLLLGRPIALTSANKSNEVSSLCIDEFRHLWPQITAIFDGGTIGDLRTGSTIVDLTSAGKYSIIREGSHLESTVKTLNIHKIYEL